MNLGSTYEMDEQNVERFIPSLQNARIVTCEISQVPLSGVIRILNAAKSSGCLTILDVDVSPSVAVDEAKLGTKEEILKAISLADVVKPAGMNELYCTVDRRLNINYTNFTSNYDHIFHNSTQFWYTYST